MSTTAYAVMYIDKASAKVTGFRITGSPNPAHKISHETVAVYSQFTAIDFQAASDRVHEYLATHVMCRWARDAGLLDEVVKSYWQGAGAQSPGH